MLDNSCLRACLIKYKHIALAASTVSCISVATELSSLSARIRALHEYRVLSYEKVGSRLLTYGATPHVVGAARLS